MMKDQRGYYYRYERYGKKVHRQYIGKGEKAEAMAIIEAIDGINAKMLPRSASLCMLYDTK